RCCSRPPAPASINSPATNIADACSNNLFRNLRKTMAQQLKTDWVLFLTIVIMACFGLVMVYSASSVVAELKYSNGAHFFFRQFAWAVFSFFVLMYFKRHDYRKFCTPAWAFAPLGIVLVLQLLV